MKPTSSTPLSPLDRFGGWVLKLWSVLISLKFAVAVMVGLAACLAVATIIESKFNTATAKYYVYQSRLFYLLLFLFGLLILCVALSRWPWKKRHLPFLLAHAGILMILGGAWVTIKVGIDGQLKISEGELSAAVELDDHVLVFSREQVGIEQKPFPWRPNREMFIPFEIEGRDLSIVDFIPDAEPKIEFGAVASNQKPNAAIKVRVIGAPMGGAPEVWLWQKDPNWATQSIGPLRMVLRDKSRKDLADLDVVGSAPTGGELARVDFVFDRGPKGDLKIVAEARSARGITAREYLPSVGEISKDRPFTFNPGFKMPVRLVIDQVIPDAQNASSYVPVKIPSSTPIPAIQVQVKSGERLWLGLGDRADYTDLLGRSGSVGFFPRRIVLPFALRLKQFKIDHDPGTQNPAAYASHVQVVKKLSESDQALADLPAHWITMNEPLKEGGFTFYQASYVPDFPRPTTTVLSVNLDPGRWIKYWGSLLLTLGTLWLFLNRLKTAKHANKHQIKLSSN